jgi:hypothetical protein
MLSNEVEEDWIEEGVGVDGIIVATRIERLRYWGFRI